MRTIVSSILVWTTITSSRASIPDDMRSLMNEDVSPCEDFYEYSCGKWIKSNQVKGPDIKLESAFKVIDDNNEVLFKEIIGKNHPLLGELWDSCLAYSPKSDIPFHDDIQRIAMTTKRDNIVELTGDFFRTGTQAFTSLTVEPDSSDATIYTLYLSPAALPAMDYFYDNFHEKSHDYREYITLLLENGFSSKKRKRDDKVKAYSDIAITSVRRARTAADAVIELELDVAMIKKRNYGPTRKMSIAQAMKTWPNMVGQFLKGLGFVDKTSVNEDFKIYIEKSDYFNAMESFLKSTSGKGLKLYIIYFVLHSRVHWLGEKYYKEWFKLFGPNIEGQRLPPSRSSFCTSRLIQYMPDLFGKYYTEKVFDKTQETHALEMVESIKTAMGKRISTSKWLEGNDKIEALSKLDNMLALVGQSSISQSYPQDLSRSDYPSNVKSILSHSFDAQMKKVGQRVNRMEWTDSPAIPNAFYSLRENRIVLPTAILQPPLFSGPNVHPARNFGAIGTIIGHEMTHGFDTMGHNFDKKGNVREWWSEATAKAFQAEADRMKRQYTSFLVPGRHGSFGRVDGALTLVENIADNGGIALAWDAYRRYLTQVQPRSNSEKNKDGDKMFYIAFGQTWCTKTRDKTLFKSLSIDDRTPAKWRVNGAVMNNAKFAKTFECKADTPMNPSTKIGVW